MLKLKYLICVTFLVFLLAQEHKVESYNKGDLSYKDVTVIIRDWAGQLGETLWTMSSALTRRKHIIDSFKNTSVTNENGTLIHKEIVDNLSKMMKNKVKAVENIVETAETFAKIRKSDINRTYGYDYYNADNINMTDLSPEEIEEIEQYINESEEIWKCDYKLHMNRSDGCKTKPFLRREPGFFAKLSLEYDDHFKTFVNTNLSSVRTSPSVYFQETDLLNDVRWSEALDLTFKENFRNDPTLTWQYFASAKGFMRMYPAVQWSDEKYDKTYDFRIRSWFTEALTSPKDVVILLDNSGSMQGKWRFMARYVINDILDTLYDNDFVNIYYFNNETHPLVKCFGDQLVQANEENLRLLRESLGAYKPRFPGNLGMALKRAFDLLNMYRSRNAASNCNQVIVIITEGIDYDYKPELFARYNNHSNIRVFTYQIGTEPSDEKVLEWIACSNMGYYVNMTEDKEAHEKVLKYLNVMSRPINMAVHDKNFTRTHPVWSALYVDLADRRLTNWLWEKYEGNRQRDVYLKYAKELAKQKGVNLKWYGWHFINQETHPYEQYRTPRKHTFLTTISLPVYDKRKDETSLLGVAAVDIPIDYIKSFIAHYRIGTNGYAFIVTNNGYLILHPDHRTEFVNILKPTFNRVDMVEVEIMDDNTEPRLFNASTIIKLRDLILNRTWGTTYFHVRTHIDDMKRVILSQRHYFYGPLGPFSLVVALPAAYGFWNVLHHGEEEKFKLVNMEMLYNKTRNWSLHPDWLYCKDYGVKTTHNNEEEELLFYMQGLNKSDYKMPTYCDPRLVKSFLADFYVTQWFDLSIHHHLFRPFTETHTALKSMTVLARKLEVIVVFMATHSGLTRWQNIEPYTNSSFSERKHTNAIDEVWYQRAADANFENKTFVYSVPFYNEEEPLPADDILVTASNAIFIKNEEKKALVAAMGYQFKYRNFHEIVLEAKPSVGPTDAVSFYILDNNGFVMDSKNGGDDVGKFFGDIRPDILEMMVEDGIYIQVRFFDYQAICYFDPVIESPSSRPFSLLNNLWNIIKWILSLLLSIISSVFGVDTRGEVQNQTLQFCLRKIAKKVPTPCDQDRYLYTFPHSFPHSSLGPMIRDRFKLWYYAAELIPRSNLLILAINETLPPKEVEKKTPTPRNIYYGDVNLPCYIATKNNYTRRTYFTCRKRHEKELFLNRDKKFCGGQGVFKMNNIHSQEL